MKELVILIGLPGSGKTTYCNKNLPGYFRISQDDQGRKEHRKLFTEALGVHNYIVVDRCNFNKSQRERYTRPAKAAGYKVRMIFFKAGLHECVGRILNRPNHPTLHSDLPTHKIYGVVETFAKLIKEPKESEYDDLVYI